MLEQWEADQLLRGAKIYTGQAEVDLSRGADNDYQVESDDGTEFFLLDVRTGTRSAKTRLQLRYRRNVVLARLCTRGGHTNPDGEVVGAPHYHSYTEGYGDGFALEVGPFEDSTEALLFFCKRINLPEPRMRKDLQ